MTTVKIGEAIYSILKKFDKVYPCIADQGTTFPFIIYRRSSGYSLSSKDGIYSVKCTIDVIVAAAEYQDGVDVAEDVIQTMEAARGNIAGFSIDHIRMIDSNETVVDKAFVQEMRFEVEFS